MSYLQKLLDGADVEWKLLGEVCDIKNGYTPSKDNRHFWENGTVPWFRMEDIRTNGRILNDSIQHVTHMAVKSKKLFSENSIIISTTATIGEHALITSNFLCNQQLTVLSIKDHFKKLLNHKYLFHYGFILGELCKKNVPSGGFALVNTAKIKFFLIPIPCPDNPEKSLAIQTEIVRILDTFTTLTAELAAELAARKKQYNYYHDQLFTFPHDQVEWKTLGDVGDVKMCKRILKNQTSPEGDIPFYKIGTFGKQADAFISKEIYKNYKNKYSFPRKGDVLISASGTIGRAVIYDGAPAYFQDSNIVWLHNDERLVSNRYLWHFYKIAKWFVADGGTIDRLYNDNIYKTKIPIPFPDNPEKSLAEQARIVSILDKFDTLTHSIREGLPREIELRQKQYEYYRDLLLNFPKPEGTAA